jgi:ABC-type bacteriocin/lantibiotic exporter with double-glycine peptidase domain
MTDLIEAPKPALLFVNDNHYIVIDSISSNRLAYGRDPAYGRYSISLRGLKKSWNGETLVFRN